MGRWAGGPGSRSGSLHGTECMALIHSHPDIWISLHVYLYTFKNRTGCDVLIYYRLKFIVIVYVLAPNYAQPSLSYGNMEPSLERSCHGNTLIWDLKQESSTYK